MRIRGLGAWLSVLGAFGCAGPARTATPVPDGRPRLVVMTYNVNYGIAGDDATIAAIRDGGADLVLLQETTPEWERALRPALGALYPHVAFHHAGGAGGLAVLSRFPFRAEELVDSPVGWFPGWRLVVDSPVGKLQILDVHLHPPVSESGSFVSGYFTTGDERHAELLAFTAVLDPTLPAIVAGDFNEERGGRAVALLEGRGMRSVLEEYHPRAPTWRWPVGPVKLRYTLDHIFYDAFLEPVDARVLEAGRSDHLPVVATFVRGPSGREAPPAARPSAREAGG